MNVLNVGAHIIFWMNLSSDPRISPQNKKSEANDHVRLAR